MLCLIQVHLYRCNVGHVTLVGLSLGLTFLAVKKGNEIKKLGQGKICSPWLSDGQQKNHKIFPIFEMMSHVKHYQGNRFLQGGNMTSVGRLPNGQQHISWNWRGTAGAHEGLGKGCLMHEDQCIQDMWQSLWAEYIQIRMWKGEN